MGFLPKNRMPVSESSITERLYECAILYAFPLSQKEEQDIQRGVERVFEDGKAKQVAKDIWGRRGLAYPIRGHAEGSFVIYHYEMDPSSVAEIDEALRLSPGVLRHLLIKPPKHYEVVRYSEQFDTWIKERKEHEEHKVSDEEENLKRKVAEKAKRQVARAKKEQVKTAEETSAPLEKAKLAEELEKLISDDELNL